MEPLTFLVEDQIKRATATTDIYISNYGKRAAVTTLCNSYATVIITVLEKCKHYLSV